jgi:hypothetical protein
MLFALPFNSKLFYREPLSIRGGKTLYFASNMPGSLGGTDFYGK